MMIAGLTMVWVTGAFLFAYVGGRFDKKNESMADVAGSLVVAVLWPLMLAYILGGIRGSR